MDAFNRLQPHLHIHVISPYARTAEAIDPAAATRQGDYIYRVQALPRRYVEQQHRDRAVQAIIARQTAH